jgi:hypothetical protein
VFGIVVAIVFQNDFHLEMYQNNIYSFFKIHYGHQHIKTIQKHQKKQFFYKTRPRCKTKRGLNTSNDSYKEGSKQKLGVNCMQDR